MFRGEEDAGESSVPQTFNKPTLEDIYPYGGELEGKSPEQIERIKKIHSDIANRSKMQQNVSPVKESPVVAGENNSYKGGYRVSAEFENSYTSSENSDTSSENSDRSSECGDNNCIEYFSNDDFKEALYSGSFIDGSGNRRVIYVNQSSEEVVENVFGEDGELVISDVFPGLEAYNEELNKMGEEYYLKPLQ